MTPYSQDPRKNDLYDQGLPELGKKKLKKWKYYLYGFCSSGNTLKMRTKTKKNTLSMILLCGDSRLDPMSIYQASGLFICKYYIHQ
tara:strand:- start:548 stop:805 length:258 start_codon:yes stop_codon:yes gene_type:complete